MRNYLTIIFVFVCPSLFGQTTNIFDNLSSKSVEAFVDQTVSRIKKLNDQTNTATERVIFRLQAREDRFAKKLKAKDSLSKKEILSVSIPFYHKLMEKLQTATDTNKVANINEYIPYFDTLKTSLAFLGNQDAYVNKPQLKEAQQLLQQYQSRLQITNTIRQEIQQHEHLLKQHLQSFGFVKDLTSLNKEIYYYQQQLEEYKALLEYPKKIEKKLILMLSQTHAFKEFMQKNSMLSSLFVLPGNNVPEQQIAGLQSRTQIEQALGERLGALSNNGNSSFANQEQFIQQQVQTVQPSLDKLKDKLNGLGGTNTGMEMSDFKPNTQKSKPFMSRFEYGIDIQNQRSTAFLPTITDMAIKLGYKFSDNFIAGVGIAYKLGWGNGWNHISLTNQGIGFRSYADLKIKGTFWMAGGFEYNYMHEFKKWEDISNINSWQRSGLIGVSKKYKIGKRDNNIQVLWDFLSYNQIPKSQAIKFRFGFDF